MRLFVAINLPESIQHTIQDSLDPLRSTFEKHPVNVRWVRPDQYHLTLKFLGEQPEDRIIPIQQALKEALRDQHLFSLTLAGFGCFPAQGQPHTLWIGVSQGSNELKQVALSIEETLARAGYPKEQRLFNGHLTIGRILFVRNVKRLREYLRDAVSSPIGPIVVTHLDLMQSRLGSGGPVYTRLDQVALKTE